MSLNKVMLIGRLGADPEIRYSQDEKPVANFSIATNSYWNKDGERQKKNRVAPNRCIRPQGRDLRRVPEKGPPGVRRGSAKDQILGGPGRKQAVDYRGGSPRHSDARQ